MTLAYLISTFRPAFSATIPNTSEASQHLFKAAAALNFTHRFSTSFFCFTSNVCRRQAQEKVNAAQKEAVFLRSSIADGHSHDPAKHRNRFTRNIV